MPAYTLSVDFVDSYGGKRTKRFEGSFADDASATTGANDLLTDIAGATNCLLTNITLAKHLADVGVAGGNSVFMAVSATVELESGKLANVSLPAPVEELFSANTLIITAAEWTAFIANFLAAGDWTVSDGESVAITRKGARVFQRSGSTNLL